MRASLRELRIADREGISAILRTTRMFHEEEIVVALELVDAGLGLGPGEGYRFRVAEVDGRLAGYACWGLDPMTDASFNIYWIAVDPALQGHGIGRDLMGAVEEDVTAAGGRMIVLDTAG